MAQPVNVSLEVEVPCTITVKVCADYVSQDALRTHVEKQLGSKLPATMEMAIRLSSFNDLGIGWVTDNSEAYIDEEIVSVATERGLITVA